MRRIAIVLAVLFLTTAFAQATEIGFKAGLNYATVTGDPEDIKAMLGFGGGAFLRLSPSPTFSIQPEALFTMKGAQGDYEDADKTKLWYLEIPVLFMFKPQMEGSVGVNLFAGPTVGLLMSAKEGDEDYKDDFKSTEFGVAFGAGLDLKTGEKGKVCFDARYTLGLSDISEEEDWTVKNSVFSFFVGYAFPIGQ